MYQLDFAALADQGLVRETNQDVARVAPRLGLALVADGMGGHDRGALASSTAARALEQSFRALGGRGAHFDEAAEHLQRSFDRANRRVSSHQVSGEGRARMGTTLVAAVFAHGRVVVGNVGDSRCYRLREGSLERLTQDHSHAAEQRRGAAGVVMRRPADSRWAHALTRCINGDEGVAPDMLIARCEPGDVYLLCSDGLWGTASGNEIARILAGAEDAEEACEGLVGAAWAGGGLDNIGVAVVRLVPRQLGLEPPSDAETMTPPAL